MMAMYWPQMVLLFLMALTFAAHCFMAGQPRDPYNPIWTLIDQVIAIWLLYEGGFFKGIVQ